jgi:hypothetical protein
MSMTVAELIDKLRAMPQDMRVVVANSEYGGFDDPVLSEDSAYEFSKGCWSSEVLQKNPHESKGELVLVIDII